MVYEGKNRLGELFRSRREKGGEGLPRFSVTISEGLVPRDELDRKMETNLRDNQHLLIKEGDIAYNMMRMWQGAFGRADTDGAVSPAYVVLTARSGIDSLFAAYLFKSHRLIHRFWAYSYGLTEDRLRLYFRDFAKIRVTVPSVPEQTKIAKILLDWDRAIHSTRKLVESTELQKHALMLRLLRHSRDSRGLPNNWHTSRLGDLFMERSESNCESLPLLAVTREEGIVERDSLARRDTSSADKSAYKRVLPGDIAYNTMRMWQGISALSSLEGVVSPAYTVVTPKSGVCVRFMAHLFKHPRVIHDFYRYSQGLVSDTWNLKFREFRQIRLGIPDLGEQERIAEALDSATAAVKSLQRSSELLVVQKHALMQQLLTGKRRVRLDSAA
jgi:type I restriction enzyme, S subunit